MRIEPGRRFANGEVSRLAAPAVDATAGVQFGGAVVDDYGGWAPAPARPRSSTAARSCSTYWRECRAGNVAGRLRCSWEHRRTLSAQCH